MKLNIANPFTGSQKFIDCDDEKKLRVLYDKRISHEVAGEDLSEEFKGYVFKISGGNDKQGFPMRQGVLCNHRVRLLLTKGSPCYRQRRKGEKKRKSVRGCIVGSDLAVLNLVVVKVGDADIPGLSERIPRRVGPKRASKIRKLFNLSKTDNVKKFVIGIKKERKGKIYTKRPKIQRLITPMKKKHDNRIKALKKRMIAKSKESAAEYGRLLAKRKKEALEARQSRLSRRNSSRKMSRKSSGKSSSKKKSSVKKSSLVKKGTKDQKDLKNKGVKSEKGTKVKKDKKTKKFDKTQSKSTKKVSKSVKDSKVQKISKTSKVSKGSKASKAKASTKKST